MYAFPDRDTSCSMRASSSPVVAFGHGFSSSRRSVLPKRCLSTMDWNWNRASENNIIRARISAKTGPLDW